MRALSSGSLAVGSFCDRKPCFLSGDPEKGFSQRAFEQRLGIPASPEQG